MSCCGRIAHCVSCLQSLFGNNNPKQRELNNQNEIEMELKTPPLGGVCVFFFYNTYFCEWSFTRFQKGGKLQQRNFFLKNYFVALLRASLSTWRNSCPAGSEPSTMKVIPVLFLSVYLPVMLSP